MPATELFIDEAGSIQTVYEIKVTEALRALGNLHHRRASYVEPGRFDPSVWEILFCYAPKHFMTFGPFTTRERALEVEKLLLSHFYTTGELLRYCSLTDSLSQCGELPPS